MIPSLRKDLFPDITYLHIYNCNKLYIFYIITSQKVITLQQGVKHTEK